MGRLIRNVTASAFCVIALTLATGGTALAGETLQTPTTGQPGAPANTCGTANPVTPGNSADSPGSPFNTAVLEGVLYVGHPTPATLPNTHKTATPPQSGPPSLPV